MNGFNQTRITFIEIENYILWRAGCLALHLDAFLKLQNCLPSANTRSGLPTYSLAPCGSRAYSAGAVDNRVSGNGTRTSTSGRANNKPVFFFRQSSRKNMNKWEPSSLGWGNNLGHERASGSCAAATPTWWGRWGARYTGCHVWWGLHW